MTAFAKMWIPFAISTSTCKGLGLGSFDADLNEQPFGWISTKIKLSLLVHNVKP